MPGVRPIRRTEIVARHKAGYSDHDIAEEIGIKVSNVRAQLCQARALGILPPIGEKPASARFNSCLYLKLTSMEKLKAEAKKRNLPTGRLVRKLLETIIEDDMFLAILDDK